MNSLLHMLENGQVKDEKMIQLAANRTRCFQRAKTDANVVSAATLVSHHIAQCTSTNASAIPRSCPKWVE
jgi:hypothetical protein